MLRRSDGEVSSVVEMPRKEIRSLVEAICDRIVSPPDGDNASANPPWTYAQLSHASSHGQPWIGPHRRPVAGWIFPSPHYENPYPVKPRK